jgi:hypothetical protein
MPKFRVILALLATTEDVYVDTDTREGAGDLAMDDAYNLDVSWEVQSVEELSTEEVAEYENMTRNWLRDDNGLIQTSKRNPVGQLPEGFDTGQDN